MSISAAAKTTMINIFVSLLIVVVLHHLFTEQAFSVKSLIEVIPMVVGVQVTRYAEFKIKEKYPTLGKIQTFFGVIAIGLICVVPLAFLAVYVASFINF